MADKSQSSDGPSPFSPDAFDYTLLPDWDDDFVNEDDLQAFAEALAAPDYTANSQEDLPTPASRPQSLFITALNDWRPVRQRARKPRKKDRGRGRDEARQGFSYDLLKWPLLLFVLGWILFLFIAYIVTRIYILGYEQWITWQGRRQKLRKQMNGSQNYEEWVERAQEMDRYLGNDKWKNIPQYAYYDCRTIARVKELMSKLRAQSEADIANGVEEIQALDELRSLTEACVKSNFVGFENPRLYSETYYGTKTLVQEYVDEVAATLNLLAETDKIDLNTKRSLFKHLHTNFGRTALCLSGGATFAYYHFGIAKALMDADLMPEVITGTSGGALVAALLCTRTDEELKQLLVPALAHRISACHESFSVWVRRWWETGARFDSIDWARRCGWFCHGSMTFREAYERTGRILNVSCVPSDPHSPTILANYLTSPDCVIWSAVLASAAVPGILNPVVLMKKVKSGKLEPYAFGHKWKDGSLRTDIPLKALNLHFNVSFSIVSQVNPHVNLFFFSSRGSVGRPVSHRRGRGWRGGFIGSATEQYLKLDLTKWLKVLRHLELLPRPAGQDWSNIWLQRFSGTITIWPKVIPSDFVNILSDPPPERLARMIRVGQMCAWPKLNFIANRMKIERALEAGRRATRTIQLAPDGTLHQVLSEEDIRGRLHDPLTINSMAPPKIVASPPSTDDEDTPRASGTEDERRIRIPRKRASLGRRLSVWWNKLPSPLSPLSSPRTARSLAAGGHLGRGANDRTKSMADFYKPPERRGSNVMLELRRQSRVFFDDVDFDQDTATDFEDPGPEMVREGAPPTGTEIRRELDEWEASAPLTKLDEEQEEEEEEELLIPGFRDSDNRWEPRGPKDLSTVYEEHEDLGPTDIPLTNGDRSGESNGTHRSVGHGERRDTFLG